jgi:hypothetical protein
MLGTVANATPGEDFGDMLAIQRIDQDVDNFAGQISRVERELLWAHKRGLKVPPYVARAFREAVELAEVRRAA